jgi:hypothetical protein
MIRTTDSSGDLLLSRCDVSKCEAMCCHDGVYLMEGEEQFLRELVDRVPPLKESLPEDFVVDGYWRGELFGRKTATRPHSYLNAEYPTHFPRTRCVFADSVGLCELEKLARRHDLHPWTFKPATCWLFPLNIEASDPAPPPKDPALDPYRFDNYPGYVTCVPCGRHDPNGRTWRETLKEELEYLEAVSGLPILGSEHHSVGDLLPQQAVEIPIDTPRRVSEDDVVDR